MSISVVNGYLCENSCDVAKAKKGEDPHPKVGSELDPSGGTSGIGGSSRVDGPAVVFGGALAKVSDSSAVGDPPPVTPDAGGITSATGIVLDILA